MPTRLTATSVDHKFLTTPDHVGAPGKSVEIKRPRGSERIIRDKSTRRLAALKPHPGTINGNPDELAHLSWEPIRQDTAG